MSDHVPFTPTDDARDGVRFTQGLRFTKGHGTENDFVLVPDLEGTRDLSAGDVARLADRHAGIGGDGVIRVVPTRAAQEPDVAAQAEVAAWFMDYRNADGSIAEMCGNGTRVFAAYLRREGLETADELFIATRAGTKRIRFEGDLVAVHMGQWRFADEDRATADGFDALVHVDDETQPYSALSIDMGNPHTVVALPPDVDLAGLDLLDAPVVNPLPPEGTNVEFVRVTGPGALSMRVHERGVGETRSCGTGVCAAALASAYWAGESEPSTEWTVQVPGGQLTVRPLPGREVELVGPAVLVADGHTTLI
ncbi:diaminopimelate epimerase [Janibacter sp. G56]|uniref:diaminopimelate epimerase n=1 Tax=Janibacter sp. G56 TaxID=3418717 RepID=UPI003CFD35D4